MKRRAETRVAKDSDGKAIELWLAERFSYLDEASWRRMLREGRLAVNGRPGFEGLALAAGDIVAFDAPPREEPAVDGGYVSLYEDSSYLVVDKPPLLPCHPGGAFFEHSLWYLLRRAYGPVHIATRLDRETSGLVLVCKDGASAARAQSLGRSGGIAKEYLALVHGAFPELAQAEGYLERDEGSAVRKKRRFVPGPPPEGRDGAEACSTRFALERREGPYSLVRAFPATGRTHQIRASLLGLGFPVVGDKLYGLDEGCFLRFASGALDERDRALLLLPHQALHCARLSFAGSEGSRVEVGCPPPWGLDGSGVWTRARAGA